MGNKVETHHVKHLTTTLSPNKQQKYPQIIWSLYQCLSCFIQSAGFEKLTMEK